MPDDKPLSTSDSGRRTTNPAPPRAERRPVTRHPGSESRTSRTLPGGTEHPRRGIADLSSPYRFLTPWQLAAQTPPVQRESPFVETPARSPQGGARMRNSRFVVALVAVACAAALPAAAAANNSKPGEKSSRSRPRPSRAWRHGKGCDHQGVRLSPAAGQTAKGVAELKQRANALSVALVVARSDAGRVLRRARARGYVRGAGRRCAHAARHLRQRARRRQARDRRVPTAAGANYFAGGFSIDVHAGPSASATPVISCGDIAAKAEGARRRSPRRCSRALATSAAARSSLQKGSDVAVWIKLQRPDARRACAAPPRRLVRGTRCRRRQPR